ncbi:heterokaryon incompatibility protein-domain-containing protein [Phaeosphaeriaceae sp. PMI808]|nr:heterokaryon incompatibility protein-domain-containing protein [Phaeosphaeriaceae sp. PMI808]
MGTIGDASQLQALCETCKHINLEALKDAHGFVHLPSFKALMDSTSGCELCKLILEACTHYADMQGLKITAETSHLGPVRLFATGQKGVSSGMGWRNLEPLQERQLSPKVVVIVGKLKQCLPTVPSMSILLEMYALEGSAAEQAGVAKLREIESHAACEANFSRLKGWLECCRRHHVICSLEHIKPLVGSSPMPKRLIDLGLPGVTLVTPKIIDTKGRQEQYVALSYCWGPSGHLSTKKENIKDMKKSIPIESLPRTIKDAFLVARNMDVRYIWIDALCIIQDDNEEWDIEAKRMGAIYANSYFTIAATCAEQSGDGFLRPRTLNRVSIPLRLNSASEIDSNIYFRNQSDFLHDHQACVLESPLLKRAWVLQETLLSRRTVHFSSKQIYWECRCAFYAEDGMIEDADCREHAHEFLNMISILKGGIHSEQLAEMFFRIWGNILLRYSNLSITRPSDKLLALSGLASLAELVLGYRYLYGIWNFNLPYGLFWHPVNLPMVQATEWRAPSWSWAALEGAITLETFFPVEDSRIRLIDVSEDSQLRGALKIMGQIHPCYVSLDLQPQPKPCRSDRKLRNIPVTPPEYAFAEDKSKLLTYRTSTDITPYGLYGEKPGVSFLRMTEGRLMSAQDAGERNVCRFDGERGIETDFFFLRLSCADQMEFHHCRGLLLRRAVSATGAYERVGIGWSTDSLWHTTSESLVTLV